MLIYIVLALVALIAGAVFHHQRLLRDRALLMREAIRHRDFSYHLPTRGMLFGEKALQETLNDMGQEIQKLIARNEVEAWQRLTRVLTHEIMNATTPIQAVSQAYLQSPQIKGSPYEEGIQAIYDTSKGLAAFVDSYRKLTCFQEPQVGDVSLLPFCQGVAALYPHLAWRVEVPPAATLRADAAMLRQVLINLVKNAAEAGAATMGLRWDGRLYVSNDGHTIPDDVAREIFVPFFTTKPTGSGIGLSMSRQMLVRQGLSLMLRARPLSGYNVTFVIESET